MNSLQRFIKLRPTTYRSPITGIFCGKNNLSSKISTKLELNNNSSNKLFSSGNSSYLNRYYTSTTRSSTNQTTIDKIELEYKQLINNALDQFKLKQLQASIKTLDQAIQLCKNKADAILLKADIQIYYKNTLKISDTEAFNNYKLALTLVPDNQKAEIYRSLIYSGLKNPEAVTYESLSDYFNKLYELDLNNEENMYEIVLLKSSINQLDQGLMDICKKLLAMNSKYGTISLAFISMVQQNFEQAKQLLQQVIDTEVQSDVIREQEIYHKRFVIVQVDGFSRIQEPYDQDLSVLDNALYNLGAIQKMEERYQESYDTYQKCLKNKPLSYFLYSSMGECMSKLGNHKEAIELYTKAIDIDPELETAEAYQAIIDRGALKYLLQDYDGTIIDLRRTRLEPFELGVDKILDRAFIMETLIYSHEVYINNIKIDAEKFNLPSIIKQMDTSNILSTPPKNIQQLFAHTSLYFKIYSKLLSSITSGLVKCADDEVWVLRDRESLFYYLSRYLQDSMYLNYHDNHAQDSPWVPSNDKETIHYYITQLPYRESKQSAYRQAVHKTLFELYDSLTKVMNEKVKN